VALACFPTFTSKTVFRQFKAMRPSSVLYGDDRARGSYGGKNKSAHWPVMNDYIGSIESTTAIGNAVHAAR
jgi:hypothetical protein